MSDRINLAELRRWTESVIDGDERWSVPIERVQLLALVEAVEAAQDLVTLSLAEADREEECEKRLLNALGRFEWDQSYGPPPPPPVQTRRPK